MFFTSINQKRIHLNFNNASGTNVFTDTRGQGPFIFEFIFYEQLFVRSCLNWIKKKIKKKCIYEIYFYRKLFVLRLATDQPYIVGTYYNVGPNKISHLYKKTKWHYVQVGTRALCLEQPCSSCAISFHLDYRCRHIILNYFRCYPQKFFFFKYF